MGNITILPETTRNPITLIGERAGVCWGADITDAEKNYRRGMDCIQSGHGRVLEYVNVETIIDGYSARVIREWYTHIGGAPTRLQASTRYINYRETNIVMPPSVIQGGQLTRQIFLDLITHIRNALKQLEEAGIPREDAAMLLPLGMTTRIVDKRNLRNLIDMSRQRMCNRAYWEFRQLFRDLSCALAQYSEEWGWIVNNLFKPKCEEKGYCPEKHGCGMMPGRQSWHSDLPRQSARA